MDDDDDSDQSSDRGHGYLRMGGMGASPIFQMPTALFTAPLTKTTEDGKRKLKRPSLKGLKKVANASLGVANASLGSVRTAATTLLGDRSFRSNMSVDSNMSGIMRDALERSERERSDREEDDDNDDNDSLLLWEDLQDGPPLECDNDQIGGSSTSIDFSEHELQRLKQESEHTLTNRGDDSSTSLDDSELGLLNDHFYMDDTFHDSYSLGKSLGQGSFGSVRRCMSKSSQDGIPPKTYAVKSVPLDKFDPVEMEILMDLKDCPHIVQVQEIFHDHSRTEDKIMIVMEEIEGGELLERIAARECYSEQDAKAVIKTLLETVQFCHRRGIAHCDIKPENIMLRSKDNDTDIKLVDFGLARRFRNEDGVAERLWEMHGSPEYAAPEVFNRDEEDGGDGYDERCDIWSCGVVLYVLLGGYGPFEADTPEEMIKAVAQNNLKFHKRYWKHISREAKILIARMLQVDPDLRCSLEEALASPWFDEE